MDRQREAITERLDQYSRSSLPHASPSGTVSSGWYTDDVEVAFTCAEIVTQCPETQTIEASGSPTLTGTISTTSDESYDWTYTAPIDAAKPTIYGTAAPAADSDHGFDVTWTCDDAASGVARCPDLTYVSGLGEDTHATGTAVDVVGHTSTATVTDLVTSTHAPTITATGVTSGATYPVGTSITVGCTAVTAVPGKSHAVPCTVAPPASTPQPGGAVSWSTTITATDDDVRGLPGELAVSWTVSSPVTATPTAKPTPKPAPTPTTKPAPASKPRTKIVVSGFGGLPTRGGVPVLDYRKHHPVTVRLTIDGKPVAGKPVWLRSVETTKSGKRGTPKKVMNTFKKQRTKGTWINTFRIPKRYAGEYRKFGVKAADGRIVHVTVYVK